MSENSEEEINIKNIINEKKINSKTNINLDKINKFLSLTKKAICKIKLYERYGTCFFCKIPNLRNNNIVLITNNNILNKKYFEKEDQIKLEVDEDKIYLEIRDRKIWTNETIDLAIIEIRKNDNINYFLTIDENINSDNYSNLDYKKMYYTSKYNE